MPVGIAWNAGAVRARLLGRHRLGRERCLDLAAMQSLNDALASLRDGPYGHDVKPDMALVPAQWAVAATPLWHLRVLAGWVPPAGAELIRALVGWWEILNVENLLAELSGLSSLEPYDLGRLKTAWERIRTAGSVEEVRARLAESFWLDPGAADPATIVNWLRLSWAQRVNDEVESAARLASGWAAVSVARDLFTGRRTLATAPHHVRILGRGWNRAEDLAALTSRLSRDGAWVLHGIDAPRDLWRAEVRWWRTLHERAVELLRHPGSGPDVVVGAFGTLLADAHCVQGALEFAARGGTDREVIDEVL